MGTFILIIKCFDLTSFIFKIYKGNIRIFEAEDKIARIRDRFDEMRSTLLEETALMQRNHSSNGNRSQSCNPYVSIRLVPDIDGTRFRLNGVPKVKTKIQERTLFPL